MKKKKGNKRKKKKEGEEEIRPTKHEKIGNINNYSEQIAKEIINKIISLSFTNHFMNRMNKKIDNYYIKYILGEINNLVEIVHINHDMDINIPLDLENKSFKVEPTKELKERRIQEKKIYNKNNNINENNNNNNEIITKKTFTEEFDQEKLNKRDILYNVKIPNNNFWETISEPKSFSFERTSTYQNVIKQQKIKIPKKIIENKESSKQIRKYKSKYTSYIIPKKTLDFNKLIKKSTIRIMDDFPSEKIPDDVLGLRKEEEDIKNLRKVFLEEIEKKNMEEKMEREKKRLEEIAKKNMEKELKEKEKQKDKDKGITPDSFIKDFILISTNQKEIKGGLPISFIEEEQKKLTEKAKKNIEYNYIPKIKTERELFKQRKTMQKIFVRKFVLPSLNIKEEEDDEGDGVIIPAGVNFDLMQPEIGVVIQEDEKIKSGGVNYYEKYNRFSLNDYNKTMSNILERNIPNFKNIDTNNFSTVKLTGNNINNNTVTAFNKNKIGIELNKKQDLLDENKNAFGKTFMNKLSNFRKKFIYKSNSEICLSNNYDNKLFMEVLSTESQKNNNLLGFSYRDKRNKKFDSFLSTKYISPIPSNLLSTYNNTIIRNYQNTSRDRFNKYKIMDTFNKNIVDKNYKFNEILYQKINTYSKKDNLPKIQNSKSPIINQGRRTKNSFLRTRKKEK